MRPVVLHSASTPPVPEPTEMGAVERMRLRAAVLSALVCLALGEVYVPGSVPVDDDAPQVRVGECVPGDIPTDGPDPTDNCNAFFKSQGMSYDAYPIPPVCSTACTFEETSPPDEGRGATYAMEWQTRGLNRAVGASEGCGASLPFDPWTGAVTLRPGRYVLQGSALGSTSDFMAARIARITDAETNEAETIALGTAQYAAEIDGAKAFANSVVAPTEYLACRETKIVLQHWKHVKAPGDWGPLPSTGFDEPRAVHASLSVRRVGGEGGCASSDPDPDDDAEATRTCTFREAAAICDGNGFGTSTADAWNERLLYDPETSGDAAKCGASVADDGRGIVVQPGTYLVSAVSPGIRSLIFVVRLAKYDSNGAYVETVALGSHGFERVTDGHPETNALSVILGTEVTVTEPTRFRLEQYVDASATSGDSKGRAPGYFINAGRFNDCDGDLSSYGANNVVPVIGAQLTVERLSRDRIGRSCLFRETIDATTAMPDRFMVNSATGHNGIIAYTWNNGRLLNDYVSSPHSNATVNCGLLSSTVDADGTSFQLAAGNYLLEAVSMGYAMSYGAARLVAVNSTGSKFTVAMSTSTKDETYAYGVNSGGERNELMFIGPVHVTVKATSAGAGASEDLPVFRLEQYHFPTTHSYGAGYASGSSNAGYKAQESVRIGAQVRIERLKEPEHGGDTTTCAG